MENNLLRFLLIFSLFNSCTAWRAPLGHKLDEIPEVLKKYNFPNGSKYELCSSHGRKFYAITLNKDYQFNDLLIKKGTIISSENDGRISTAYSDEEQNYRGVLYPRESMICIDKNLFLRLSVPGHGCGL